jgi:predicted PurR-regulated permease PerM
VTSRRRALVGLLAGLVVLAGVVLADVLGTVFFAVTVAYLLAPVHRRAVARGLAPRPASALVTLGAALAAAVPLEAMAYLAYRRREILLDVLASLPDRVLLDLPSGTVVLTLTFLTDRLSVWGQEAVVAAARAAPTVALQATLFAFLVFALLVRQRDAADALLAVVPTGYHDIARALHERTRDTLYAIYVLQAATAVATFLLAYPTFRLLGYEYAATLSVVAALLQFLPVVGPSLLVVGLALVEFAAGAVGDAVLVAVVGLVVVAGLPDVLVRPRLAQETADLPGSLYFVGFVGGLLTVGPVGIIAGPLAVALVAEAIALLAAEG